MSTVRNSIPAQYRETYDQFVDDCGYRMAKAYAASVRYRLGKDKPNYPVPAIIDPKTKIALRWYELDMPHIFRQVYFDVKGYY